MESLWSWKRSAKITSPVRSTQSRTNWALNKCIFNVIDLKKKSILRLMKGKCLANENRSEYLLKVSESEN